ncbi:DNA-directed RNA polymerase subunit H [Candidatus Lokiarchaeum ossiferum]|uniref:DNA-directed RNA polymerase subunit H n=1 Tax=Candidatus Lokiarchaeum ossiferum TaxID=2951803 RepID=A0ABY6HQR7_9ARCH|nr:DNA-directed RNA polymerase subunit H [Candidatus Lokiarchaeum sp. B-35]
MVTAKSKKLDVLAHELVPSHTILTKAETDQLLKDYSIRLVNLPRIFEDDPAALALGAKEGSVVKIVRKSTTMVDRIDTYRFVVVRRT